MSELETVVLGIVSGILTTAILYLLALFLKQQLLPWYQGVSYKGVDINDTCICEIELEEGRKAKFEMTINQKAHNLSGDTTVIQGKDIENPSLVTNFKVEGTIWEGFVTLNMQSKDRKRLSYSTSLLQVINGGATLKGMYVYRSIRKDSINTVETTWRRKSS